MTISTDTQPESLLQRYRDVSDQVSQLQTMSPFKQMVNLIAVSKTHPAESVRALYNMGQVSFAENYLQEALSKQAALLDLDIQWHYIGSIQSNKTRQLAASFDWIHSVARLLIAEQLSTRRPENLAPLNICLQVNIDNEPTKSGCLVKDIPLLVAQISRLPNIQLRGLMCIPSKNNGTAFASLQKLFDSVVDLHENPSLWDTLSMGMSADLAPAILAGATQVRVGTAIFGSRA